MNCLNPIVLKSGVVVPCGHCELCRSDARNEWSIRLAIHLASQATMPMFITLTYSDDNLPMMWCDGEIERGTVAPEGSAPTLFRPDVSKFLKAYKRKYHLSNEDFQYFGCGEYGGKFGRPHYHLLFFGDKELYELFFDDTQKAQDRICSVWKYGFAHVGVAGYDGIHYCTKYVLKDDLNELPGLSLLPFTIASNGLGMNFLNSVQGKAMKRRLDDVQRNKDLLLESMPDFDLKDSSSIKLALDFLGSLLPRFEVILDDGRKVFLPRAIRKKLVGTFEYFKDSPYWVYTHLKQLYDSQKYYEMYADYDVSHDVNKSHQVLLTRLEKIRKRLLEQKYLNSRFQ